MSSHKSIDTWLSDLGLEQLHGVFAEEQISLDDLPYLSEQDLEKIGVPLGPRKRLMRAIAKRSADAAPDDFGHTGEAASARATLEGERRQLTVLFCDIVRYTELASTVDLEVLQEIVRTYEDACAICISRYEGYVFQRLGDGIVAFFGYPLAHEGEAERAIRAGLEIIDSLTKLDLPGAVELPVRIGIATGLVVVSSADKGAVGEAMNLAARLQAIAEPGSIFVSERVRRLAGGAFSYEDQGEQSLKGIAQPTHAFRVLGVREVASRFEAARGESLMPLVGRELELGLLMDHWARAQEGEGQVVLLSGEAGIGKSRILKALRERLEANGAKSLHFQCSPYYVNSAFWPSINNFERALKFARDESVESKLNKLESLIVDHYQRPLADVRFVAAMLSISCDERYGTISMTPRKFKDETLRTLIDLVEAAARTRSRVLFYEDLHWADPTSLEVLDLLIDRIREIPLLAILTHRPDFQNRWTQHEHVSALKLSKLTRTQSRAIVSGLTASKPLPDELLEQILAKTDGVPLFVEELTKSILESGELTDAGDRYEYAGTSRSVTIPATLRDSLMARLDRHAAIKEIAQIGAVIGREFSYELILAVATVPRERLDDELAQLTNSGLAFRRGTSTQASYVFKHALVQDTAYESLLKSKRQELHAKIAKVIEERFPDITESEPEVLAHHLSAAGATALAIPLWKRAGELSFQRMALAEAISHLNKGLDLNSTLPKSDERDTSELFLRNTLGIAWTWLKGWAAPEVWESFHPGLGLAESLQRSDAMLPILWGLSRVVRTAGRVAESLQWCEEMLKKGNATGDSHLILAGHTTFCISRFYHGELTETLKLAEQVRSLYVEKNDCDLAHELTNDPKTAVGILESQATWMLGYPDRAVTLFDEAVKHARHINLPFDLGWALSVGADLFDFRCEPQKLRACIDQCEELGRENSMHFLLNYLVPAQNGIALLRENKLDEGISSLREGLAVWNEANGGIRSPYLKAVLAEAMAKIGNVDAALELLDEQIEQIERPGWEERPHYAEILRLKGWTLSLNGNEERAEMVYLASLEWAREQKAKSWELRTSSSLARLWQGEGQHKKAHDLLKPVYDWFTEGFDTKDLKDAQALLNELEAAL